MFTITNEKETYMNLELFLQQLSTAPDTIEFDVTLSVIDQNYLFTETAFQNGDTFNEAGQNNGSCKLFAFAKLNALNESDTLACFGKYYREDVLKHPDGTDHQNIRNFMVSAWSGIQFKGEALTLN